MLRKKIVTFMILLSILLIGIIYFTMNALLVNSILQWERKNTEKNVRRVKNIIEDEIIYLEDLVKDWACRDDTYAFVAELDTEFMENNLINELFSHLKIGFMVFLDSKGKVVFQKGYDRFREKEAAIPYSLREHLQPGSHILLEALAAAEGGFPLEKGEIPSGIILLPEGPLLIAASPILTSRYKGSPAGTLFMGSFLDSAGISRNVERSFLKVTLQPPGADNTPEVEELASSLPGDI